MEQRALVIRYGDPALSDAIETGIASGTARTELETVKAELERMRAREAVRMCGAQKRLHSARAEMADKYAVTEHGRAYSAALGLYGLVCYGVAAAWQFFAAWNRS